MPPKHLFKNETSRPFHRAAGFHCFAGGLAGLAALGAGFTSSLLEPAHQLILPSRGELPIVVRELRPFLFQLALGNIPITFDFERVHNFIIIRMSLVFGVFSWWWLSALRSLFHRG
jgi:hypothetical protein